MADYIFDTQTGEWTPHPRIRGVFIRPLITPSDNPGLTISRIRLLPGAEITPHRHPLSTETFIILSGIALCRVGETQMEMCPGQMGYAPPGMEHGVCNPGTEPVEALSIFNPPLTSQ